MTLACRGVSLEHFTFTISYWKTSDSRKFVCITFKMRSIYNFWHNYFSKQERHRDHLLASFLAPLSLPAMLSLCIQLCFSNTKALGNWNAIHTPALMHPAHCHQLLLTLTYFPFLWRLIMEYFLWSFSPFPWFKKGSCQFLVKECAQYWLITLRTKYAL